MNTYINAIVAMIEDQINSYDINLIRLEGIESPIIYEGICKELKVHYADKVDITAKLSVEKFNSFRQNTNEHWQRSLDYLEKNNLVDVDNAMTRWRNSVVENSGNKVTLVLLMGTEAVQDKGGLGDFYLISPDTIIEQLEGKYHKWFVNVLDEFATDTDAKNAIDTLFRVIYSKRNIDIERLSYLIDEIERIHCSTVKDVIEEICFKLDKYFGIPPIKDVKKIPTVAKLKKKTLSSAGIISKSYEFINRDAFKKNYIKEIQVTKYREMIDKYQEEKDIRSDLGFPEEEPVFSSYDEFGKCLIQFIKGESIDENRKKLLRVDFGIISDILKIKVSDTKTTSPSEKEIKLKGDPISVYSHMILESIRKFNINHNELPKEVEIEVESVRLSGCVKEELELEKRYLCAALGGIVSFLNKNELTDYEDNGIRIYYKDDIDVFNPSNEDDESVNWGIATKINDLCKIKFNIKVSNEADINKNSFLWLFESKNEWKNAFKGMIVEKAKNEEEVLYPFIEVKNIGELFRCESDEAFYSKLDRTGFDFNKDIMDVIHLNFSEDLELIEHYNKLVKGFNDRINSLMEYGLFNTIQELETANYITDYVKYITYLQENVKNFTINQREVAADLLNSFCITSTDKKRDERVLIPPCHPIMLEKMVSKLTYLRGIYKEIFVVIKRADKSTTEDIVQRIQRGNQLATIECGADVVLNRGHLMCCSAVHGMFALYESYDSQRLDASSSEVGNYISDEDGGYTEFQVKPYTKIIQSHILEYIRTFPARCDGMNIVFINPIDTNHIVKAVEEVRKELDKSGMVARLSLRICLPYARSGAVDYLRKWSEGMEEEESQVDVNMFVSYLDTNNYEGILESGLIKGQEEQFDISFMYNVLTPGKPEFKLCEVSVEGEVSQTYKFPTNTMPDPISASQSKRYISISQHQFEAVKAYTLLAHLISEPNAVDGEYRVQRVLDMAQEQPRFLNDLHKHCRWVICVDEAIDKESIQNEANKVIGFTSGEGNSGELNITLSTRGDVLNDICNKLYLRMLKKFSGWSADTINKINQSIFDIARQLDGSKILKALNPNDYSIYNFLAYVLVAKKYKLLEHDDKYLVRVLINLDTHMHWFSTIGRNENLESKKRPDLLLLEIENTPNNLDPTKTLDIKATVIECKMGKENYNTVLEAQQQVEEGLKILAENWDTTLDSTNKKYWYGQLYRTLVFNPITSSDNSHEFKVISEKMRKINQGKFKISWQGEIYAFWLDNTEENMVGRVLDTDIHDVVSNVDDITYYHAGQPYIKAQLNPYNLEENMGQIDDVLDDIKVDEEFENNVLHEDSLENPFVNKDAVEKTLMVDTPKETFPVEVRQVSDTSEIAEKDNIKTTQELCMEEGNITVGQVAVDEERNHVETAKAVKDVKDIRVLLGEDLRTKEKIYWEFGNKQLNNRHLLISGNSGTGKTYCIQTLMYEMTTQGVSCIVFDYTDGFTTSKLDPVLVDSLKDNIEQRYVVVNKFPLNPFKKLDIEIGDMHVPETIPAVATRMASVFTSVYKFGMQQNGAIYKAVRSGLEKYGDQMSFRLLADELEELGGATATSILSKIQAFLDIDPFDTAEEFSWQDIMDKKGQMYVVQLTGFTRDIQLLLTEFILWDIWNFCVKYGNESKPLPIIIDEAQNLSHGSDSPTGKILTEGRKFGISGWFATQFLKGALKDDEIQRLQQAGQKLYFAPPEKEVTDMAKNIDINSENAKEWAEKLKKLQKGNCITAGQMVKNGILTKYDPKTIKVISLEERSSEKN
nr:DUF87 domain-containing protein [uncultured Cellulosilyticum sp.]